jgi:hypothetical protein
MNQRPSDGRHSRTSIGKAGVAKPHAAGLSGRAEPCLRSQGGDRRHLQSCSLCRGKDFSTRSMGQTHRPFDFPLEPGTQQAGYSADIASLPRVNMGSRGDVRVESGEARRKACEAGAGGNLLTLVPAQPTSQMGKRKAWTGSAVPRTARYDSPESIGAVAASFRRESLPAFIASGTPESVSFVLAAPLSVLDIARILPGIAVWESSHAIVAEPLPTATVPDDCLAKRRGPRFDVTRTRRLCPLSDALRTRCARREHFCF